MQTDDHARFHQECLDFAEWVRIKDYTKQEVLFSKIRKRVREKYHDAQFVLFGSAGSQLAIRGSDIDVLVHAPNDHIRDLFPSIFRLLISADWTVYVEKIVSNVPILKIKDVETGLNADICFNREDGYKGAICALSM